MADTIREVQDELGLSDEGLASYLSDAVGTEVTVDEIVRRRKSNRPTKAWREALGLPPPPPRIRDGDDSPPEPGRRSKRQGPAAPEPVPELDWGQARMVLVELHVQGANLAGKALKDPLIGEIMRTRGPSGQSPAEVLADDWIALAHVDERAKRICQALTAGGPAGKLLFDYLMLVTAYLTRRRRDGALEAAAAETAAEFVAFTPDGRPVDDRAGRNGSHEAPPQFDPGRPWPGPGAAGPVDYGRAAPPA